MTTTIVEQRKEARSDLAWPVHLRNLEGIPGVLHLEDGILSWVDAGGELDHPGGGD